MPLEAFMAARPDTDQPNTQYQYHRILQQFEEHCQRQGTSWQEQDADSLDLYTQQLAWARHSRGGLYSANTLDQTRRVLRHFYRWAFSQGLIATNPTQHWILPRPHQPTPPSLTRLEVQQLMNLPDLSTALGQRDQLLMEVCYGPHCVLTRLHLCTIEWNPDWEPIRLSWERYVRDGRARLLRGDTDRLFLNRFGSGMTTITVLRRDLEIYGKALGAHVNLRILQHSFRVHTEELSRRHFKGHPPQS
jgi:site-specific recombinase XerD